MRKALQGQLGPCKQATGIEGTLLALLDKVGQEGFTDSHQNRPR